MDSARDDPEDDTTALPSSEALQAMSVKELRKLCYERGVDLSGCVEKGEIIGRLCEGATPSGSPDARPDDPAAMTPDAAPEAAAAHAAAAAPDPSKVSPSRKPMSLRAAVKACNCYAVQVALVTLGDNAAGALDAIDGTGSTLLHTCAANAALPDADKIAFLLIEHSGSLEARDRAEKTPLSVAVDVAASVASVADCRLAVATIRSLLLAGATPGADEWRSEECPLALAAGPAGGVAELLLEHGCDLPWHPSSLRASVHWGDADGVQVALDRLGRNAGRTVNTLDATGRSLLHTCASNAAGEGAGRVAQLLLGLSDHVNAVNSLEQTPLELAVAAALVAKEAQSPACLATIRALLEGGASSLPIEDWRSEEGMLACAATRRRGSANAVVELLQEFGADFPWSQESLQAGIRSLEASRVQAALERLGDKAGETLSVADARGRTLLHSCAARADQSGASAICVLLIFHKAQVDVLDLDGQAPLALAVSVGIAAVEAQQTTAMDTILSLLVARASTAVEAWQSEDSALAKAAFAPPGDDVAELLLSFGADLPWHPLSLQAAVRALDAQIACSALEKLKENARFVLEASDGEGRTLLHLCAERAAASGAERISQLLIEHSARVDAQDSVGRMALEVAVDVAIAADAADSAGALRTIRSMLAAGASACPAPEWRSAGCALARAAMTDAGKDVVRALVEAGVELPWHEGLDELREKCGKFNIPVDSIGFNAASSVLLDCERWRDLGVKDLRAECKARKVPTEDCVERGDLVARLRQARIHEEIGSSQRGV